MYKSKLVACLVIGILIGVLLSATTIVLAGNLDPASGPGEAGSQMYTLEQIYNRLNNGKSATKMSAFTEPSAAPASTMRTLNEIYDLIGMRSLAAKTGQKTSYHTHDDGYYQHGVGLPIPRFTDNNDGTVTDNLTGLIWLKNADCTAFSSGDALGVNIRAWDQAIVSAITLANGYCGLSDGSVAGDWRLPNVRELHSLINYNYIYPTLSNSAGTAHWTEDNPFQGVHTDYYWSSTSRADPTSFKYAVNFYDGRVIDYDTNGYPSYYVWPVRGDY